MNAWPLRKAECVTLPGDVDAAVRKIAETAAGQHSSTAQDLVRAKRSEIDHLNGSSCGGAKRWASRRRNRLLHVIVKLIREAGSGSIASLEPSPKAGV